MYEMALSKAENSLSNLKINPSLIKHLSNHPIKSQNISINLNKEAISIHQIHDLLGNSFKKLYVKNDIFDKFMDLYHNP
jgi:hypothetical protein